MKVCLYQDETLELRLDELINNLNRLTKTIRFRKGRSEFHLRSPLISSPSIYQELGEAIEEETHGYGEVVLFTEKPYDNNYFWESKGNKSIVSFSGWDYLTKLTRNNGAVYFICAILLRGFYEIHKHKNTGCINDFWRDKTGIDTGMRTAYICPECVPNPHIFTLGLPVDKLTRELTRILNDLSSASRANMDICDYWALRKQDALFDVFLCYNSEEISAVKSINLGLKRRRVKTWLDKEKIPPGRSFIDLISAQIPNIRTVAVCVGKSGIGPWQQEEIKAVLQEFVKRKCPIIPVLLPDCTKAPELPVFLRQFTFVDFRKSKQEAYKALVWGIKAI